MKPTLKKVIKPLQVQLIKRGVCVACGRPLSKAERFAHEVATEKVVCKCGRIFIYDCTKDSYRRAGFNEV